MSNLNPWQKLSWIFGGLPFGTGQAGNQTISSDPNTRTSVTASSGSNTLTLGSAILNNGDCFLIIQMQGTGAGTNWEFNKVVSGGGTTTPTLQKNLHYAYTTHAQVVKFSLSLNSTISGFTVPNWNGTVGGISVIVGRLTVTVNSPIVGAAAGFRGGSYPSQAEGNLGNSGSNSRSPYGSGGASCGGDWDAGGGGGQLNNGQDGGFYSPVDPSGSSRGYGGLAIGTADGLTLILGGGGGDGSHRDGGGNGGPIVIIISQKIILNSTVTSDGQNGHNGSGNDSSASAGGAGGMNLLMCGSCTLGTNNLTAKAGLGGNNSSYSAGNGSDGINVIHHSGAVSGSTLPTYNDIHDYSLLETGGAALLAVI